MSATTISSYPTAVTFAPNAALPAISYTLPASLFSSAQTAVQLTLNLCSAPEGYNQSQVDILTAFTNDTWTYGSRLYGGFGNITVPVISPDEHVSGSVSNGDLVIHLDTQTPSGRGRPEDWTFELGIAQVDTPWHTLDKLPLFAFEDADNVTALLTSPTYSAARSDAQPAYTPLLALSSDVRNDLANSSCYIRSLPQIGGRNITSSTTRRGVVELDIAEGGQVNETEALGRKVQYAISGLETGSNYTVWGIQPRDGQTVDGSARLFSRQFLATKRNANCRLLFDVPFCPDVAYSVPAPPALDTGALLDLYNASIAPHIEGFNLTLSTFTCGGPMRSEQGMYSRVRTCSQCLEAYRSWLCAIRMPRCVDYRTGAAAQAPTLEEEKRQDDDDDDDSGASRIYTYQHASANTSRTEFLPDAAFPYSELPPCIDVCHLVAASCPPPISASWQCPAQAVTLPQSYSRPFTLQEPDDDKLLAWGQAVAQGGDDQRYLQAALEKDGQATRAKDRWGNVICNEMGVIALTERRRWSGSAIKNAAMGRWQQLDFRIALLPLLWTLFSL